MIQNYFKLTFRNLIRNKVYATINIGGLALGMATAVLLMLWVQNEWRFDGYHQKASSTYRIKAHNKIDDKETWHWSTTPLRLADHLKESVPEVQTITRLYPPFGDINLSVNNEIFVEKKIGFIDKNWFDVFDYTFVKSNAEAFTADKYNIALTESSAKKYFGEADPLGKIIKYDSLNLTVKAVLKDAPSNSSFQFDILVQNELRLSDPKTLANDSDWGNFNYETFIVCTKDINAKLMSEKFTHLLQQLRKENNISLEIQPLTDVHFDSSIQTNALAPLGSKSVLTVFSIIAFLILLIACINYINLTTAKASQRIKEVSIKKMIGASKSGLFQQFFSESIFTSFLAMILAIVLIGLGLPLLENITDARFSFAENPAVWAVLGVATLLSILLTGIYPSFLLSSFHPIKLLRGSNIGGAKSATFRKGLVVFQFTFTTVLLIATFLIFRQLRYIHNLELGYNKDHIFSFTLPWNLKNRDLVRQTMLQKLQAKGSILAVTISNENIIDVNNTHRGSLDWSGRDPNWRPGITRLIVANNYQDFFNLKLTEGRWFETDSKADDLNVILNETAVKEFGIPQPVIGQRFKIMNSEGQIIGIAKDFHFHSPKEKISPLIVLRQNDWLSTISVKTAPNQIQKSIASTERIWKELVPNKAFKYAFLDETYDKMHRTEQRQLSLFNAFAGIVLLISCFGLFGLATFAAETRIKEIGIRKVLGASVPHIVQLLSKDFIKLVIVSILIASPIAYYGMNKWLQDFAYRINIDWWVFALTGVLALFIALVTVSFQAIKAAIANPVKSLRTE